MAPEQVRGESHRLDGRTDLWGLGVILYRMLTEHRPFEASRSRRSSTTSSIASRFRRASATGPFPKGLERICLKCLSKRMADRYATAADLADDLRYWLRTGEDEPLERSRGAASLAPTAHETPRQTTALRRLWSHATGPGPAQGPAGV